MAANATHDVVLSSIGDVTGTTFIQITVAPVSDETTATANADELLRPILTASTIE